MSPKSISLNSLYFVAVIEIAITIYSAKDGMQDFQKSLNMLGL